jgi:subtilase family serine protease
VAASSGSIGGTISATVTVRNRGTVIGTAFRVGYYYSTDATITTGDVYAGTSCDFAQGLDANSDNTCTGTIAVPAALAAGTYYVGAIADDQGRVAEGDENNNARAASSTTTIGGAAPDLIVEALTAPSSGTTGSTLNISTTIRNQGSVGAAGFRVGLYFSIDTNVTTADIFFASCTIGQGLAAGAATVCMGAAPVPVALSAGTYYVGAIADDQNAVPEANESNNARASTTQTTIAGSSADLSISTFTVPATGTAGATIAITMTVQNQGAAAASAFLVSFFFSPDATITTADTRSSIQCAYNDGIAAGRSGDCNINIGVPSSLAPGTYYVGAIADEEGRVFESDETNNTRVAPSTIAIAAAAPDLVVEALTAPTTGQTGQTITVAMTIRNQGSATSSAFRVGFYFSTDARSARTTRSRAPCASSRRGCSRIRRRRATGRSACRGH